jgi:soluble lytic murein transglycosylase-like protein
MRHSATTTLLGLGGLAGAIYLARRLVRGQRSAETAVAEASLALAAPRAPVPRPTPPPPHAGTAARPGPRTHIDGLPRLFDPIFAEHGHGLPVAFLRALGKRESNLDPGETKDPAWGLLQIIEVVRRDYNERHGTSYARRDLLDPVVNVKIGADLLTRIIHSYAQNHPNLPNLQPDWENPRFVELLTFGWNAGYSERGGVGRVARYLEQRGVTNLTIDTIFENARAAGATRHLSNPNKVRWSKGVAALYVRERARDANQPTV